MISTLRNAKKVIQNRHLAHPAEPISVKGTELTIKAFASVPGQKDSAVVTGIYRIRE